MGRGKVFLSSEFQAQLEQHLHVVVDRFVVKLQSHTRMLRQRRAFYEHLRSRHKQLLATDDPSRIQLGLTLLQNR